MMLSMIKKEKLLRSFIEVTCGMFPEDLIFCNWMLDEVRIYTASELALDAIVSFLMKTGFYSVTRFDSMHARVKF